MAEPKTSDRKYSGGAWVITGPGGTIVESSEIKALRAAITSGGVAQYVKYGEVVGAPAKTSNVPSTKPIVIDAQSDGF